MKEGKEVFSKIFSVVFSSTHISMFSMLSKLPIEITSFLLSKKVCHQVSMNAVNSIPIKIFTSSKIHHCCSDFSVQRRLIRIIFAYSSQQFSVKVIHSLLISEWIINYIVSILFRGHIKSTFFSLNRAIVTHWKICKLYFYTASIVAIKFSNIVINFHLLCIHISKCGTNSI